MDQNRIPKQGEIYKHFKNRLYQIITVAQHSETQEMMVVYQALYGDFNTYVRPLEMFLSEIDSVKYPGVEQKYRFELFKNQTGEINNIEKSDDSNDQVVKEIHQVKDNRDVEIHNVTDEILSQQDKKVTDEIMYQQDKKVTNKIIPQQDKMEVANDSVFIQNTEPEPVVNAILLKFLDAESYSKKLDVLTSNMKHMNDRLINDMAVALDCAVDEGPIDKRIQGLIYCLQAMCRFEDRRLR